MSLAFLFLLLAALFFTAFVLTGLTRHYAIRKRLFDLPNERSSHTTPTPRGGGFSILLIFCFAVSFLVGWGEIGSDLFSALVIGSGLVGGIGFWDDHAPLAPRWRILVHTLAAAWGLYCLGGFPPLDLGFAVLSLGWVGNLLALLGMVWLINLYNFMDGIDGIAGAEAVFASIVGGVFLFWQGQEGLALVAWSLSAASAGFLCWNMPPAKVFMGDVGSGFLGYAFGILMIASARPGTGLPLGSHNLWLWVILLSVFIADATVTLFRRIARSGYRIIAHRSHAYQHLSDRIGHLGTTLAITGVNLFFLFPAAYLGRRLPVLAFSLAVLALVGLGFAAIAFHAGREGDAAKPE
ncbi:MAG: glycosyltransferase family 4 protein [Planctomycetota bacterium]